MISLRRKIAILNKLGAAAGQSYPGAALKGLANVRAAASVIKPILKFKPPPKKKVPVWGAVWGTKAAPGTKLLAAKTKVKPIFKAKYKAKPSGKV